MGATLKGKNLLQCFALYEITQIYKGGNNATDRVASPESVPIHINSKSVLLEHQLP